MLGPFCDVMGVMDLSFILYPSRDLPSFTKHLH
jgi:hypothetical protein